MSLYLGKNLISGNKPINLGVRNIGEVFPALLPVTDAGAHLLDGSLILGGGIYQGFVDYIANIVSIYPDVFTTESAWQSSVTTYGVCGKFVYNATDNTVRLPKVTGIIEGTTDVTALGDLVEAGLPVHTHTRGTMNITGTTGNFKTYHQGDTGYWTGAFGGSHAVSGSDAHSYSDSRYAVAVDFNASRSWTGNTSNPIYTNNIQDFPTVQPQTIKVLYYIVIANSTKTEIQTDIDEIATDLNNKVGKNGDSVNGTYYATTEGTVLVVNNTNITDSTGTPTASTYAGIQFNDANNVRYGKLEGSWNTDGTARFGFNACRNVNGSNVYAQVNAWVDANGNTYFNFPKCTTKATTTSSASNNKVAVVTQNYVNGTSWYRVYSDGWCEQGGFNANYGGTITLLKKMSNNTYTCLCCHNGSSAKGEGVIHAYNKTTTSFNVGLSISTSGMYGYSWYVSGYIN